MLTCMYIYAYTYNMKTKKEVPTSQKRFLSQVAALWPAVKGSLAQVRKPCIRPNCPTCASGAKHPAFLLSFTQNGRRRCMYVPDALAPQMKKAIDNGRRLETLLYENGPLMLQDYRAKRAACAPESHANTGKAAASQAKTRRKS